MRCNLRWITVLSVAAAVALSACSDVAGGSGGAGAGGASGGGGRAAACADQQKTAQAAKDLPVTIMLVPSAPGARAAAQVLTSDRSFDGVGIIAAYAGPTAYQELARAAISGLGAPNHKYAEAHKAAARRCLAQAVAAVVLTPPPAARGDALTAVALGFEAARAVTADAHLARVVVYGAGNLVTSGLDLGAADIATPERQEAVVGVLQSNGLLDFGGGPESQVVFAGLSDDAANGLVARQREALFKRLCGAADAATCSTSMGTPS